MAIRSQVFYAVKEIEGPSPPGTQREFMIDASKTRVTVDGKARGRLPLCLTSSLTVERTRSNPIFFQNV